MAEAVGPQRGEPEDGPIAGALAALAAQMSQMVAAITGMQAQVGSIGALREEVGALRESNRALHETVGRLREAVEGPGEAQPDGGGEGMQVDQGTGKEDKPLGAGEAGSPPPGKWKAGPAKGPGLFASVAAAAAAKRPRRGPLAGKPRP